MNPHTDFGKMVGTYMKWPSLYQLKFIYVPNGVWTKLMRSKHLRLTLGQDLGFDFKPSSQGLPNN